ncbi:MAG: hypothetical protein JKY49_07280 [Cohaesibacteraceae bacterium]|nr:hypothetical protein [Cohaesibacteraceae bacterium]MBL4874991.1 hypothetical protein [Cohaesibacteraceae bacterium]
MANLKKLDGMVTAIATGVYKSVRKKGERFNYTGLEASWIKPDKGAFVKKAGPKKDNKPTPPPEDTNPPDDSKPD